MKHTLKHHDTWRGTHRGFRFEIIRSEMLADVDLRTYKHHWTFYLYLPLDSFPEDLHDQLWLEPQLESWGITHHDSHSTVLHAISWHCGLTFYTKVAGLEGGPKIIKAGCDYGHLWDQGINYSLSDLETDARRAIDGLYEIEGLRVRCQGTGLYHPADEMVEPHGDGYLYHRDYSLRSKVAGVPS